MSKHDREALQNAVREIIIALCPEDVKDMQDSSRLVDDLGYHSLAMVELAFAIEDKFDIEPIDQDTASGIQTVGDILSYVTAEVEKLSEVATA